MKQKRWTSCLGDNLQVPQCLYFLLMLPWTYAGVSGEDFLLLSKGGDQCLALRRILSTTLPSKLILAKRRRHLPASVDPPTTYQLHIRQQRGRGHVEVWDANSPFYFLSIITSTHFCPSSFIFLGSRAAVCSANILEHSMEDNADNDPPTTPDPPGLGHTPPPPWRMQQR